MTLTDYGNKKHNEKIVIAIYSLFVFCIMLFYFLKVAPIMVYDTDDWTYISVLRAPIPIIGHWNPTRVFPETFMPIVSYFGAFFVSHFVGDYFLSLVIVHGLFGSLIFTLYFVELPMVFFRKKLASIYNSIGYGALFLLLHFTAFIHTGSENYSLFSSLNLTCFYFYTLSFAINAFLVMHFISYGGVKGFYSNSSLVHKLLVLVLIYFAINSNLYSSVVLASYTGTELLVTLICDVKRKEFRLSDYCIKNLINLGIIVCWGFANLIERTGGRATMAQHNFAANLLLVTVLTIIGGLSLNIFITAFGVTTFVLWKREDKKKLKNLTVIKFVLYCLFTLIYIMLLSAIVDPTYVVLPQISICVWFYVFLALLGGFNEVLNNNRKEWRILFILAGTVLLLFITPGKIYMYPNFSNISYSQCEGVMNDIINQYKHAEQRGLNDIDVIVPAYERDDNWPLADFSGERISTTLYEHNIVGTYINVNAIIPSDEKNKQFGIKNSSLVLSKMYRFLYQLLLNSQN